VCGGGRRITEEINLSSVGFVEKGI